AREYRLAAMHAGKDIVSANKLLPSQHGEEPFQTARDRGVRLRFEAAVAGVVPVVRVLEESLSATPIERISGIVNGTTNFVLTEMARGSSYAEALADAQRRGFAEADPSDDVSGRDAAAKMAILARLAFGRPVHLDEVHYEGIEHLHGDDLEYARDLGLGLKLIGTAERREGGLSGVRGEEGVSVKSVVHGGMGEGARRVMVTHPVQESRLRSALTGVGEFAFVRADPRMSRGIEEEWV